MRILQQAHREVKYGQVYFAADILNSTHAILVCIMSFHRTEEAGNERKLTKQKEEHCRKYWQSTSLLKLCDSIKLLKDAQQPSSKARLKAINVLTTLASFL